MLVEALSQRQQEKRGDDDDRQEPSKLVVEGVMSRLGEDVVIAQQVVT